MGVEAEVVGTFEALLSISWRYEEAINIEKLFDSCLKTNN